MEGKDKRSAFLGTVLKLIQSKGFKAMTMRDLATEMQCDVANIYNYTKSKDALLEELLFGISEKFHVDIRNIENAEYSSTDKLKAVVALHIRLSTEQPNQVSLLVNEWRNLKEEPLRRFIEFRANYEKSLQRILHQGVQNKEFSIENIEFTSNCILSSIRWLYGYNHRSFNPMELERMMKKFIFEGINMK